MWLKNLIIQESNLATMWLKNLIIDPAYSITCILYIPSSIALVIFMEADFVIRHLVVIDAKPA
jgi:hypothetical protein